MGEIEGSYRALQTPGTRLGSQFNPGISTLEPGQNLNSSVTGGKGKCLQIRVQGLDDAQEFYEVEVSLSFSDEGCDGLIFLMHNLCKYGPGIPNASLPILKVKVFFFFN